MKRLVTTGFGVCLGAIAHVGAALAQDAAPPAPPPAAAPTGTAATGRAYGEADPEVRREEIVAKLSSDINKVDHSIEVTKGLVKKSPDAPYLADLYFRLAELYVERSRYVYQRLMEQRPIGESTLPAEQSLEVAITKRLAIETYDKVLTEFPEYDKNDQIYFFRAHEYRELGEFETMLKQYKELIEKFGKSDWAIEARLILADHHFDKGELTESETYYNGIIELPESHLHDMARYKMGWIRINQEKYADALKFFEDAVKSGEKRKRGAIGDAKSLNVKREALLALTWPFTEVKKAPEAPSYFKRLAGSKTLYVQVLSKLANRYFVKTEYESSATLYREIVRLSADVEENADFIQRIYDSVRNISAKDPRRYTNASEDVGAIVKTVARFQNHWKFSDEDKKKLTADFEIRARDLATRLDAEARKKGDKDSAGRAAEAYRLYLSLFNESKELRSVQDNRATALFQAGDFVAAGEQYEQIAKPLADSPERRELLYSAISSFYKAIDDDAQYRAKHPTSEGLLNKLQLLRAREGLKQVGAYYVKAWPKSPNTSNVKFNIARMYFQQGEYETSAELFKAFVLEYPTHKDTLTAGLLALDAWAKVDDFDNLGKLAKEFVESKKVTNGRLKTEAARIGEAARKRNVEIAVIHTQGDFTESMIAGWEKHKGSQEGEDFLYAAFVKYKTEGNVAGVFDFGGRMIGAYPQSTRLKDVLATMGSFAVRAADFERAAALFDEYAKRFPQEANANDVALSAANIRYLVGDYERSAEALRNVRRSGNPAQQRKAHGQLMDVYRDARDYEQLARVAQTALQEDGKWLAAAFHLGLAYSRTDKPDLAERELQRAVKLQPRDELDKDSLGQATFELGKLVQRVFDSMQFTDAQSAERVLGQKLQMMERLERAYLGALQSGHAAWGIAALHALARVYAEFAKFIAAAPVPDGMDAASAEQYRQALAGQAAPFAQKGQETLTACQQKAEQLNVMSAYAAACLRGSYDAVDEPLSRRRGTVQGDETYQKEMGNLRQELAKKPESIDLLITMGRRAIGIGDAHLAKLALSKAAEIDPNNNVALNLLGVANWQLERHQDAFAAFERAAKGRYAAAMVNLAALYASFSYEKGSKRWLREAGDLSTVDFSSPDLHPAAAALRGGEGAGT